MEEIEDPWAFPIRRRNLRSPLHNLKFRHSADTVTDSCLDQENHKIQVYESVKSERKERVKKKEKKVYQSRNLGSTLYRYQFQPEKGKVNKKCLDQENHKLQIYEEGILLYKEKNYALAINFFTETINSSPLKFLTELEYVNLYNLRANAYNYLTMHKEAFNDLTIALKIKPNDSVLYFNRGFTSFLNGQIPSAIIDFNTAINYKKDPIYYYRRGKAKKVLRKYNDALNDFNIAIKYDSNNELFVKERRDTLKQIINLKNKKVQNSFKTVNKIEIKEDLKTNNMIFQIKSIFKDLALILFFIIFGLSAVTFPFLAILMWLGVFIYDSKKNKR